MTKEQIEEKIKEILQKDKRFSEVKISMVLKEKPKKFFELKSL